jgi:hypothetical protein
MARRLQGPVRARLGVERLQRDGAAHRRRRRHQAAKAATESNEVRRDGMRQRGRHGTQKIAFAYNAELSLGSHDAIIEAICRDTWSAGPDPDAVRLHLADHGRQHHHPDVGRSAHARFRVGDVIDLTNFSTAANDLTNLRITGLSATTITVAETLVVNAVADTTCSIIRRGKKLTPYAGGGLVKKYFTLEEYEADIDQSTVLTRIACSAASSSRCAERPVHGGRSRRRHRPDLGARRPDRRRSSPRRAPPRRRRSRWSTPRSASTASTWSR